MGSEFLEVLRALELGKTWVLRSQYCHASNDAKSTSLPLKLILGMPCLVEPTLVILIFGDYSVLSDIICSNSGGNHKVK